MAYTRRTDYVEGAAWFAAGPALMWFWEKRSPSFVGKGGFAPMMRLTIACSATAAFFRVYQKSTSMQHHRLLKMITVADYCSEIVWVHRE